MKLTTAGESHGKALVAIIEGLPAHLPVDKAQINADLALRQKDASKGRVFLFFAEGRILLKKEQYLL